ncbi:MAG: hypothetical protein KME25_20180 [Symplocastrum torsivum CPER-KK1]|jgi:hypothetical protein|uniref:Uncharacterized protein n=1 Tax=Symplocastrum torsivum CPER-KK1 TaxID=450513 RepID=A0A951PNN5_9CYAN|nr:hypothetical protein [Symplocastrum torsivum CPER-KK1]
MLNEISNMPEYQWKLTIVERNLLLSNWIKLIPEAQEQMLWEADDLMRDLSLLDRQRLLTSLEMLQDHIEEDWQQRIQRILSRELNGDIRKALESSIQNTAISGGSSLLVESAS